MPATPIKIAITGAAGRIGYDLLFRIAGGAMLGPQTPVELRLLDVPDKQDALEGIAMELHDCAFDTLSHVAIGSDPQTMAVWPETISSSAAACPPSTV